MSPRVVSLVGEVESSHGCTLNGIFGISETSLACCAYVLNRNELRLSTTFLICEWKY